MPETHTRSRLTKLTIRGFKTIRELVDFSPGPLTVLIGPNGAGKSNLLSFFRMLSWSLSPPGGLQEFVGLQGGASSLLHDGPGYTRDLEARVCVETDEGENQYSFRLAFASGDTFIYTDERFSFAPANNPGPLRETLMGAGHREPQLVVRAEQGDRTFQTVQLFLKRIPVYQFHNTTAAARLRTKWDVHDSRNLKEDAGNLAPFLFRLQAEAPRHYHRIVETLRLALPFFADFEFQVENSHVLLRWRERGTDQVFHAGQSGDGMLRLMALIAVLQQPESNLPDVLILDEPELGLHPYGIGLVADLLKGVSKQIQVIVATQSATLVDHFAPEDIVVVSRSERASLYRRLDPAALREWLEEYSLSELWEKNVVGGRP